VYAVTGELVQQPIAVPGAGGGGPPTISDFDNDGLPELAVAGQAYYTIYDIDCGPTPRPNGKCSLGVCDYLGAGAPCAAGGGIAWARSTQDLSSNVTGSSVFDFEADGVPEVVYGDECFTRVYNGITGDVMFSQYRSSCTWYENPIIADVDGNFRADLVTPSNKACGGPEGIECVTLDANGVDPQFPGLRCQTGADCSSAVCDAGLCRCAADSECCAAGDAAVCLEEGYKCAPPPAGTPGAGNTCRAAHPHGVSGIRVYSDANDKWVRSRMIWNQAGRGRGAGRRVGDLRVRRDGRLAGGAGVQPGRRYDRGRAHGGLLCGRSEGVRGEDAGAPPPGAVRSRELHVGEPADDRGRGRQRGREAERRRGLRRVQAGQ
jgi:hypothetical protein